MKLPGSCKIVHKAKSKTVSIQCGSMAAAAQVLAEIRPKDAKKSPKGMSQGEKEKEGRTPFILASGVVSFVEKALKKSGRRKATKKDLSFAYAVCTSALQKNGTLAAGTRSLTKEGKLRDKEKRENLGAEGVKKIFDRLDELVAQSAKS